MSGGMWTLTIATPDLTVRSESVHSESETVLRMLGHDHHRQARIVPDMILTDPEGRTVAVLDHWDTDWIEKEGA